jgi:hypothetical protein
VAFIVAFAFASRIISPRRLQIRQPVLEMFAHEVVHVHEEAHDFHHVDVAAVEAPGHFRRFDGRRFSRRGRLERAVPKEQPR